MPETSPFDSRPWVSSYAEGVPRDIDESDESLLDLLDRAVERFGSKVALEFFGADTTYRELGEQVERAANGLAKLGVVAGDRVALVLPNCPQHVVAFYAVLRLGAIVVEHNPLYTARELRHQFEDHGARVAIVLDRVYDTVDAFPEDLGVERIVSVDLRTALPRSMRVALALPLPAARRGKRELVQAPKAATVLRWKDVADAPRLAATHPRPAATDTALIQYTSGTTGSPKGVILSHANLQANAAQARAFVPGFADGAEVFYGVLPLFHAYGLTLCLTFGVLVGARVVLFPKFDVDLVLRARKRTPPTFLPAVPPIYEALTRAAEQRNIDLRSIRSAFSGAMSLPVPTVERWEKLTGGLLVEGYGMTETSPIVSANPVGPTRRPGTVGVPFPSTDIRVVDPADPAVDRGTGEEGELLVRGPQVFQGYWGRPDETAETLLEGGWLRTGDIVTVSDDGFITVVDRQKELIITGGFNVSPTEVENVLLEHPDVIGAAVVGLPRPSGGEAVTAAVQLRDGAVFDADALRNFCRGTLAAYKVPKRIEQVDELPRSLVGKVQRREVRDRLRGDSAQ